MKIKKILPWIPWILSGFFFATTMIFVFQTSTAKKIMVKLGIHDIIPLEIALYSRSNMLSQMKYDADVVFLGDSITAQSNFDEIFPDLKIVNLGVHSETLAGMNRRVKEIKAVTPEKIFIMGGINSISDFNINKQIDCYKSLIDSIQQELPDAEIYIQSILPISKSKEDFFRDNKTIVNFNSKLKSTELISSS